MDARRLPRPSYRRAILVYLVAIVGPTLVLLYLGLQSVQRQRDAIANLTLSNLRLSGERMAEELERRTQQHAEDCLRDKQLAGLSLAPADLSAPETVRRVRDLLEMVRAHHPVTRHFFVLQGNTVLFPLLQTPLPKRREGYWTNAEPELQRQFDKLMEQAEALELNSAPAQPGPALTNYLQAFALPIINPLKALALARVARCRAALNQPKEAAAAYRRLLEGFGGDYTEHHRPYALIAALELADLARRQAEPIPALLPPIYRDLLEGRWELSAELVDFFKRELEKRLLELPAGAKESEFLDQLEFARALAEGFRHHGPLVASQVYAYAFTRQEKDYQTFYALHRAGHEAETLLGFAADLAWVERQLLPQSRRRSGMDSQAALLVSAHPKSTAGADATEARVAFKSLFKPFWTLTVKPASGATAPTQARRDLLVFAGATALILAVLVLGVVLLMRDVSREMRLNRLRSDFVSGVSHELKTPLTLIRLYGETLLYGENFPEAERLNYYQIITRESERLTHLIEKVLDFSRIDRGQKQYHLQVGNLASAVAGTVEAYRQYLKRQGFTLETRLEPELPPVRFDADAVSEAVLNLIDNAAKYSGPSKVIHVGLSARDRQVVFAVKDHGIGIPAGERHQIFQQFYRGPDRKEKGGYGLGLFLVKHIMDAHKGRIEVDSEVGQGSEFRLVFPVSAEQELRAASSSQ